MPRAAVCLLAVALSAVPARSQDVHPRPGPEARAVRLDAPVDLDGKLDEPVWRSAPPATDFRQMQPKEGEPATQRTEVRFAFDGAALYVGARMYDDSGAAGVQTRLVRRDADLNSDYLEVIVDPYHDHIGRLFFTVNPSGVRSDANGLGGGGDASWDPLWEVRTTIDSLGWTAELRIPFSQLRYPQTSEEQTWGLQIWRQENRLNELSMWSWWPLTESGGPSMFGHLAGLVIEAAPGKAELLPYVVGRSANVPVTDASDPFQDPHVLDARVGADARILLNSNLTLNATVNPDFGQVEVDPAVVNLSAFETFFEERRPFFVEGAGYFGFGGLNCYFCSNVSSLSMFYTRRVGRAPQMAGNAYASGGVYADIPDNTTILGAAKLTGRTSTGWSIGVLDALTRAEQARIQLADSSYSTATVEPLTNYFVGRVAKDLRRGATQVRAIATSVIRDLDDPFMRERLSRHAESFGVATDMWFASRRYRLMAQGAYAQVAADTGAIRRLQQSSARYFQRPDRGNGGNGFLTDGYDPTLTAMRGLGGYARFSRESGNLLWELSTNFRTPGFENNDIAFLTQADYWWMSGNIFRQWTRPTRWYRQVFFIVGGQQRYNFDGDLTDRQGQLFGYFQPLNYWEFQGFWIHRPAVLDDRLARGGPVLKRPGIDFLSAFASTDRRKKVVASLNAEGGCATDGACDRFLSLNLQFKPASNVTLGIGPSVGRDETRIQYVTAYTDSTAVAFYGRRYVFADLTQQSVSMNTRLNLTFSPNLTFELFLQPLISSGDYSRYKEFAATRTEQTQTYGDDFGTVTVTPDPLGGADSITVDPDGAGTASAGTGFRDPSFTLRSLRGNAVLRWEYRPGSTVYVVWTRSTSSELTRGTIDFSEDVQAVFRGPAENIFLVKLNYWFGL
jgi:hypothetical protein